MLSLLLVASAAFAQNCDDTNFSACLEQGKQYLETTCGTLTQNATTYAQCLCYQKVADGNCYGMCPLNATIQAEYTQVTGAIASICGAANLNPRTLVYPAPWAPNVPGPGSASMPPTGSAGTGTTSTTTTPATRNGGLQIGLDSLLALGYGILVTNFRNCPICPLNRKNIKTFACNKNLLLTTSMAVRERQLICEI